MRGGGRLLIFIENLPCTRHCICELKNDRLRNLPQGYTISEQPDRNLNPNRTEVSEIKLLCCLRETCTLTYYDHSASAIFMQAHRSSWFNLPLIHFFPILTAKGLYQFSVDCCHPLCSLPFAREDQHHLFRVLSSPEHSCHSPIPFSIKSKILNYGLIDSPSGEGKSFFCQLLSLPICFGTHFWLRRINQFAFEQCTSQTWALDTI